MTYTDVKQIKGLLPFQMAQAITDLALKGYQPIPSQCVAHWGALVITMGIPLPEDETQDNQPEGDKDESAKESTDSKHDSETTGGDGDEQGTGNDGESKEQETPEEKPESKPKPKPATRAKGPAKQS